MGSQELNTSLYKYSSKEVYDKTSDLLTVFQNHVDNGCIHCLEILKNGLGNQPRPTETTTQRNQLQDGTEEYSF